MANHEKKVAEGMEHMRLAEKCMKTSFLKWKPDFDGAASEYTKAGVAFRNAKSLEQASDAYLKAADVQKQNGSPFHAAKSMEAAALICRDMKQPSRAADLIEKASLLYLEHGTPDTAALALDRAGKMIEVENPDRAVELFKKACDVSEGEDRPRQCAEMIGKAARLLIRTKKYQDAADALKKEIDFYGQIDNHGMLNKLVMPLVLLHLHMGDYVAADNALRSCTVHDGFAQSEEASAILQLLEAYDQGDQELADQLVTNPLFRYMENDFTKLARDLKVPGGQKKKPISSGDAGVIGDEEDNEDFSEGLL